MKSVTSFLISMSLSLPLLASCTSPPINADSTIPATKGIPLILARKVTPQKTSSAEMKRLLGEPDSIQLLESDAREIWVYLRSKEPQTRRLYAFVNRSSGMVESVTWNVFEQDPESEIEYIKNELGNPELTKSEPKWTKGDSAPDEVYFKDERQRLTIVLRKTLNQVDRVVWR